MEHRHIKIAKLVQYKKHLTSKFSHLWKSKEETISQPHKLSSEDKSKKTKFQRCDLFLTKLKALGKSCEVVQKR